MLSPSDIVLFHCRSCMIFHWRCWRQCWCQRYWCCIRVPLRVMTTAVHTSLASPGVLNVDRSLCWPRCARTGIRLWLDGRNHQHLTGLDIVWRSWLNMNTCTLEEFEETMFEVLFGCENLCMVAVSCVKDDQERAKWVHFERVNSESRAESTKSRSEPWVGFSSAVCIWRILWLGHACWIRRRE